MEVLWNKNKMGICSLYGSSVLIVQVVCTGGKIVDICDVLILSWFMDLSELWQHQNWGRGHYARGGGSPRGVTANLPRAALLIIVILCSKLNCLIMSSYIQQLLQDFNSISWSSCLTLNRFLRFLAHVHKIFA